MKVCPTCNEVYNDGDINFCLADGTTLLKKKSGKSAQRAYWNDVIAIIVAAIAVMVFLGLVIGGPGVMFNTVGWTAYFVPLLIALIAWRVFRSDTLVPRPARVAGYLLFAVSLSGLISLFGGYGAIVGDATAQGTSHFIGKVGSGILLLAVFTSSILLVTNFTLGGFLSHFDVVWGNVRMRMRMGDWWARKREASGDELSAAQARGEQRPGNRVGRKEPLFTDDDRFESIPTINAREYRYETAKVGGTESLLERKEKFLQLSAKVVFAEGQQIGPYRLIRKLGRGGFGEVWLAERRAKFVTTKVAVKLPHDEQVNPKAIKQEATLWEQASGHPNVVPIIDADEYDGQVVIASEFAPDGSLDEWLKTHGKMPAEKAVETTIKILDGLAFLHSRNIIHRDLKPANILLQGETPLLADFGISRALITTVASQSENISGTFAYMSPEALDGKRSFQTDIWSVGVNLYQFVTGSLPFPQKETSVLFSAILSRDFNPLPESVPRELRYVISKALAKLPEQRYISALAMQEDLRRVLSAGVSVIKPRTVETKAIEPAVPTDQLLSIETVVKSKKSTGDAYQSVAEQDYRNYVFPSPGVHRPSPPIEDDELVEEPISRVSTQNFDNYKLPDPSLLSEAPKAFTHKESELREIATLLARKTAEFNVPGKVVHIAPGPVVTTFEFKPDAGVKYSRVTGLVDDLCLALKAESIRIDRIPGKAYVGIEVPNQKREVIFLREVIESDKFKKSDSLLTLGLGKTIDGAKYVADLTKMPHLLIAGATGAGKSVGVNTLVMSILYKARPDEVKFIMVDPKRLELGLYADIPHLATPIITDPKRAAVSLRWAVTEMERRYKDLAGYGVRNIAGYNEKAKQLNRDEKWDDSGEPHRILPYIVIIIDEFADLMKEKESGAEESIVKLAAAARAVGIHLILTTGRPSSDVITQEIKENFPSRIAFRTVAQSDSRTILGAHGTEGLLGQGDMLFLPPGNSQVTRVHGAFVNEAEIGKVVEFVKAQGRPEYDTTITKTEEELDDSGDLPGRKDPLFNDALRCVVQAKRGSTSLLQRHLRIGYGRAAAILDAMVREGYIGEMDGSTRARPVLAKAYEDLQDISEMENEQ